MRKKNLIKKTKAFRSFDFGDLEGLKKSKIINKKVGSIMVNTPDLAVGPNGESFNQVVKRSISKFKKIFESEGNHVIISHNSILNIIDLWYKTGQKNINYIDKSFRENYTNNKIKKMTGSYFKLKKQNGGIVYLARHGDTEDTVKDVYSTKQGKLTNEGIKEAKKLGFFLRNKNISYIYTSDLPRTVKTSKIILKELNKSN